ncbi:hypothetical protein ACUUL3_04220 [Thiovibrio sp. JS02]
MKNGKRLLAVIVVVAGTAGWLFHYFSDKEVVKRRLAAIAVELTKEGEETPVQIALKMKPVKDFFAPACEVLVPERNYHERLEPGMAVRYLIMYRARHATLRLTLEEILVTIPAKGRAEVSVLVHVVANQGLPDLLDETHRLELALEKREKTWLLDKAILPEDLVRYR